MSSNNTIGDKPFVLKLVLMAVPPVIVAFVGTEVLGLSRIHHYIAATSAPIASSSRP